MLITVELPGDFTNHPDPAREAVEALAVAGYESGKLSAFQARRLLGFDSRFEFEAFLNARGVVAQAYDVDDLQQDVANLEN